MRVPGAPVGVTRGARLLGLIRESAARADVEHRLQWALPMKTLLTTTFVALLLVIIAGCKKGPGEECNDDKQCTDGRTCFQTGIYWRCLSLEEAEAKCKLTVECKEKGRCTARLTKQPIMSTTGQCE